MTHGYLDYDAFDLEMREPETAGINDAVMQCNVERRDAGGKEGERERKRAKEKSREAIRRMRGRWAFGIPRNRAVYQARISVPESVIIPSSGHPSRPRPLPAPRRQLL